jgi:CheY-like chemotaxis protein
MKIEFEMTQRAGPAPGIELLPALAQRKLRTCQRFVLTSHTILVVDDHQGVRELFCSSLRELGYEVLEAAGPLQAQQLASDRSGIDLLLTGFRMADMNGVQLARWFQIQFPLGKVVLMSITPWEVEPYLTSPHDFVLMQKKDAYSRLPELMHDLLDKPAGSAAPDDLNRLWRGAPHVGLLPRRSRAHPNPVRPGREH